MLVKEYKITPEDISEKKKLISKTILFSFLFVVCIVIFLLNNSARFISIFAGFPILFLLIKNLIKVLIRTPKYYQKRYEKKLINAATFYKIHEREYEQMMSIANQFFDSCKKMNVTYADLFNSHKTGLFKIGVFSDYKSLEHHEIANGRDEGRTFYIHSYGNYLMILHYDLYHIYEIYSDIRAIKERDDYHPFMEKTMKNAAKDFDGLQYPYNQKYSGAFYRFVHKNSVQYLFLSEDKVRLTFHSQHGIEAIDLYMYEKAVSKLSELIL